MSVAPGKLGSALAVVVPRFALSALAVTLALQLPPVSIAASATPVDATSGGCSAPADPPSSIGSNLLCPAPPPAGPAVWGVVGLTGYMAGNRPAANGLIFDPLLALTSNLNLGLLPHKKLYLFLQNGFWVQRTAAGAPGMSQREFDAAFGVAWNYLDSLELRAFGYSLNNLNRGPSLAVPRGYVDGIGIENRYYFASRNIYDIGRDSFIGLGFYPNKDLIGNNGQSFRPGLFGQGYVTHDLPTPFRSYLYGGLQLTAESAASLRLIGTNFGVAIRPIKDRQSIEFRVGDRLVDDLQAHLTRNLFYGAITLGFGTNGSGGSSTSAPAAGLRSSFMPSWPDTWGVIGLPVYVASNHMSPNGKPFSPVFGLTSELNLGLMPKKKFYLFWDGTFWAQHSGSGLTDVKIGAVGFSPREMDSKIGLAWNYFDSLELRASAYALNNLNRGISARKSFGGRQGIELENRYYLPASDPYDTGRSSFIGIGYIPTEDLVGGNGKSFRPGPVARAYLAQDLPIPWFESYLYADMQLTAQWTAVPRLFDTDAGWAVRPIAHWQNLEFRIGDDVSLDIDAGTTRNLVYGAVRLEFGPSLLSALPH